MIGTGIFGGTMQEYNPSLGIHLEVLDASQDVEQEVEAFKRAIGCAAAGFVSDGNTIILDAGATTTYLATRCAGDARITVITNSLPVLVELADQPGITLVSSGGVIRTESRSSTGAGAEATFRNSRADIGVHRRHRFESGFRTFQYQHRGGQRQTGDAARRARGRPVG